MTSTVTMQGLSDEKPSSKVLNPPGGRSNNIFGSEPLPAEKTQKESVAPISNVFGQGDDDAQKQAKNNKFKAQESSQNRLFGGPDEDGEKTTGKGRDEEDEQEKGETENAEEDKKPAEEVKEAVVDECVSPTRLKGRGSYNPITGEDYEGSPRNETQAAPSRVRQPPGGHSSGLW